MKVCNLFYLENQWDIFTWSNRHAVDILTKARLNIALVNMPWSQIYNMVKVENLVSRSSVHKPILSTCNCQNFGKVNKERIFRYEATWNLIEGCSTIVDQLWNRSKFLANSLKRVQNMLIDCQASLKRWRDMNHRGRASAIQQKYEKLRWLQDIGDSIILEEIKQLQGELHGLMDHEDLKLKKRAKSHWYKNGDHNQIFFTPVQTSVGRNFFIEKVFDEHHNLHDQVKYI